jgi:hypothetical protein
MKTLIKLTLLSAVMTLALGQAAQAEEYEHTHGCSDSTLRGLYVFNATGFNVVAGVAVPKAVVEFIRFNGDGTLTVPTATRSVNGVIARSANLVGTYTLAPDCTGSITFGPPGPTFDAFVAPGGARIRMIQTTDPTPQAGPVLQGIVEKIAD